MSSLTSEQIVAAQEAVVENSFVFVIKAFEGIERLGELNAKAVQSILAENQEFVIKALTVNEPQETFSEQSILAQSAVDKVESYWHHVYEILSRAQAEFSALADAQYKQFQSDARSFIERFTKNTPAGSETAVTAWKTFTTTAGETANSVYEAASKAARQPVETAESNLNAASTAKRTRQTVLPVESIAKE